MIWIRILDMDGFSWSLFPWLSVFLLWHLRQSHVFGYRCWILRSCDLDSRKSPPTHWKRAHNSILGQVFCRIQRAEELWMILSVTSFVILLHLQTPLCFLQLLRPSPPSHHAFLYSFFVLPPNSSLHLSLLKILSFVFLPLPLPCIFSSPLFPLLSSFLFIFPLSLSLHPPLPSWCPFCLSFPSATQPQDKLTNASLVMYSQLPALPSSTASGEEGGGRLCQWITVVWIHWLHFHTIVLWFSVFTFMWMQRWTGGGLSQLGRYPTPVSRESLGSHDTILKWVSLLFQMRMDCWVLTWGAGSKVNVVRLKLDDEHLNLSGVHSAHIDHEQSV